MCSDAQGGAPSKWYLIFNLKKSIMKKFKIIFLAVSTVIFGFLASSFTIDYTAYKNTSMNWYEFVGTDPANPSHYQLFSGVPGCNSDPIEVCAVYTNEGAAGKPDQNELNTIYSNSSEFTQQADNLKYRE
jgi:hypothetical protein